MPSIENVQMYACKRFLNLSKMSCNDAIGDFGRYPLYVFAAKCIKYWLRLMKMPDTRYARLCYNMLVCYDRSGCHNLATDVWEAQYVDTEHLFLMQYLLCIKYQYVHEPFNSILSLNISPMYKTPIFCSCRPHIY